MVDRASDAEARHRVRLTSLFALSKSMFERSTESEVIRIALTAVSSLGPCTAIAGYLRRNGDLARYTLTPTDRRDDWERALPDLPDRGGRVGEPGRTWRWACILQSRGRRSGYLVVEAGREPSVDEWFLLEVLAEQTGAALASVGLLRRNQEAGAELALLHEQSDTAEARLAASLADLTRQAHVREVLTAAAVAGRGVTGIADSVHELTECAIAVEDRFGNLLAWAGPGRPDLHPIVDVVRHDVVLGQLARAGRTVRDHDRILAVAMARSEVLGVLALIDPLREAGPAQIFALEQGATQLAIELSHLRGLAEVEIRLHRELVDDLVAGMDDVSAYARADAIGHDLRGPQFAVVVRWRGPAEEILRAVEHALTRLEVAALMSQRQSGVVLVVRGRPPAAELYSAIATKLGSSTGAVGVSGRCDSPAAFPAAYLQAVRALEIRRASSAPDGATTYEELGIYRLLATADNRDEIDAYIHEWLGSLIDYDDKHRSDLVGTLFRYLECGGSYDATSRALIIHRSTLRYRLRRIREVTGRDLADVDTRLNLHVAARALTVLSGA